MSELPERIWAGWVGSPDWADPAWVEEPCDDWKEYIRADVAAPTVKPLEWDEDEEHAMGYRENSLTQIGTYWIENHENSGEWRTYFDGLQSDVFVCGSDDEEEAKAAAQADYEHRILSALK